MCAIRHARHVLGFEPWREETHRQLMLMMAQSGQRSAALAQYEICQRILAEELAIEPDAATTELANQIRVGGIERVEPAQSKRPSRLEGHTAGHSQTQSSAPSSENLVTSRGLTAPSHNLPTPSTSFIGRSEEVVEICRLLREEPECRLLSLIGSGGIGKTRLAIEVASGLKEEFDDGVYFVGLAAVSEPILIVSAIADVLGLTFSGRQDPKIQLLAYLRERHLLIVVDNFEHLLDGAELLADIVTSAPNVQLLVTSRERLNLQEEWNFTLQGMGFPQRIEEHDSVSGYPAIQLFLQRARQAETMFNPTDDEINHIGRICQLVGGAPLGIELAAAWVSTLSCHEIAQEIEQSLDFLTTSLQNVPERHRSIRAVLAQTWQRLAADEQEVMRKLSLFQGGFTYDVAKEITGVSLPMLVRLADKSLLRRSGESIRSGRYNMHDLIQRFAQEKLAEQPAEAEPVQHQFCCYFADRLQALEPDLLNERQGQVYIWIRQEIHNIQASWDYALQEEPVDVVDQFIESLGNYYAINARYHQGLHFTAQAVQRLRSVPQRDRSVDIALSKALNFQSIFQITLHDLATAEKDLHESVALSRQSEAMEHLVPALGLVGPRRRSPATV
ncbi:AAA family ATPase [Chloroflexi bacterium TSY]|nr:AAA family ATPase [Chloroflexi bacterium TSY]